jgi:hypothetical protein
MEWLQLPAKLDGVSTQRFRQTCRKLDNGFNDHTSYPEPVKRKYENLSVRGNPTKQIRADVEVS